MKITLRKLILTNYRNINHQELNFDGNSKIVGENRIGKTNTIEALYWLLTDKLLNGSSEIDQLKPLDDTKKVVSVKAVFELFDFFNPAYGIKTVSLEKQFKEEWVKTRGTDSLEFKGHSTTYIYNDVKQGTKKSFDQLFCEDFGIEKDKFQGIDTVQMLINPLYLGRMGDTDGWKNLRSMIISIVGDISDDNVLDSNPVFDRIRADMSRLGGRTDQVTKYFNDLKKGYEDDILKADGVIESLEKTDCPSKEIVDAARKGLEECDTNLHSLKNDQTDDKATSIIDDEILNIRKEIIEIKQHDLELKTSNPNEKRKAELQELKSEKLSAIQELTIKKTSALSIINQLEMFRDNAQKKVDECVTKRLNLIDQLEQLDSQINNPQVITSCPTCKRPYAPEEIEDAKRELLNELNLKKFELIEEGKKNNVVKETNLKDVSNYSDQIQGKNEEISKLNDSLSILSKEIKDIDDELETLDLIPSTTVENPRIAELEKQIELKEQEKIEIRSNIAKREESVRSLIVAEQEKKESFQKVIDDYNYYKRQMDNLEKTKLDKKNYQSQLVECESSIEIVKLFVKTKLQMLDDRISSVFGNIKFMLIEPQINGGYSTVCKPYIKGTNTLWKSGSKSEQLTTGVAIVDKIKAKLNLPDMPFIFDEGGEVSSNTFANKFETNSQLICVQVKDNIQIPTVMNI